jgi:membrane-associated phospholipid phosphatase
LGGNVNQVIQIYGRPHTFGNLAKRLFAARALWRPLVIPAAVYALIIYVYSVASGWHYATDGVIGAALAALIYGWLAKRARQSGSQDQVGAAAKPIGALA